MYDPPSKEGLYSSIGTENTVKTFAKFHEARWVSGYQLLIPVKRPHEG